MPHVGRAVVLFAGGLAVAAACAEPPPADNGIGQGQQPFFSGTGLTRGHEDITRFAVETADQLLASELGVAGFFSPIPEGEPCGAWHDETTAGVAHCAGGCAGAQSTIQMEA